MTTHLKETKLEPRLTSISNPTQTMPSFSMLRSAFLFMSLLLIGMPGFARAQGKPEVRKAIELPVPKATAVPQARSTANEPAPTTTSSSAGDNYRVRANDILEVKVYQELDLSGKVQVREDGNVRLPLINETVRVAGMSVTEIENRIRGLLAKDYVRDPRVSVSISEMSKLMFTVMGQVNRANTYAMPNNKPVSLLQAIGMAGGYTRLANPKKIYLKRTVGGQEKVTVVNAEEMARNPSGTIFLRDGDVIDVKESTF